MKRYAFRTFKVIEATDEAEARVKYTKLRPELECYCIATFCDKCKEREHDGIKHECKK